jgi:hypothetical protein
MLSSGLTLKRRSRRTPLTMRTFATGDLTTMKDHRGKTKDDHLSDSERKVPGDAEVDVELQKTKWGSTFLTRALNDAQKNVRITYVMSPGYFEMFDGLGELLEKANARLKISPSKVSSLVVVSLFGRTIGSFLAAVRLATSGQITESYAQLRACIENGAYAFYISRDPSLAGIWLARHEGAQDREACKRSFAMAKVWKSLKAKDAALERRAREAYDTCIDLGAHPNERSVTMNLEVSKKGSVTLHLFNTKDVAFHLSLLTLVYMLLCVIEIFEKVFPEQFGAINSQEYRRNIKKQHDRIAPGVIAKLTPPKKGWLKPKKA